MSRSIPASQGRSMLRDWAGHIGLWPAAALLGLYWGNMTVSAAQAGFSGAGTEAARPYAGSVSPEDGFVPASYASNAAQLCVTGCSEADLGYRWARASDVQGIGDCMDASWSFRRGCVAYLDERGRIAAPIEAASYDVPVMPPWPELARELPVEQTEAAEPEVLRVSVDAAKAGLRGEFSPAGDVPDTPPASAPIADATIAPVPALARADPRNL
jgi:hypothetical protein